MVEKVRSYNKIWTLRQTLSIDTLYSLRKFFLTHSELCFQAIQRNVKRSAKLSQKSFFQRMFFNFQRMYQNFNIFLIGNAFEHVRVDWNGFVADNDLE